MRLFFLIKPELYLFFKQESYVNTKQIKTDKYQNTQHTKISANPSRLTPLKLSGLSYSSPKIRQGWRVTVFNQKGRTCFRGSVHR